MAITQPSPSSPLLLGVGGSMPSLNAGAAGGQALGAPLQGGGFHFHFTGSLQAYQEARAGADAGRVLPPNGESLPEGAGMKRNQLPEVPNTEQLGTSAYADGDGAAFSLPDSKSIGVTPAGDVVDGGVSQPSSEEMISVSRSTGTVPPIMPDVDQTGYLQPNTSEYAKGGVDRPVHSQSSAQQVAAQASWEQGVIQQEEVQQPREQQSARVDQPAGTQVAAQANREQIVIQQEKAQQAHEQPSGRGDQPVSTQGSAQQVAAQASREQSETQQQEVQQAREQPSGRGDQPVSTQGAAQQVAAQTSREQYVIQQEVSQQVREQQAGQAERPGRAQDSAHQVVALASREQGVIQQEAAQQARQQQAGQVGQARRSETQQAQMQQPEQLRQAQQVQQEQAALAQQRSNRASGQRADTRHEPRQLGSQAEAVPQHSAGRPEGAPETIRATPAQPFLGKRSLAEPAVSVAAFMEAVGGELGRGAGIDTATANSLSDVVKPAQGLQDNRAIVSSGVSTDQSDTPLVPSQGGSELSDHELSNTVNLQSLNQTGVTPAGSATLLAEGAPDASVVTTNVVRTGIDSGGTRSQPEVLAGRADQAVQFSHNGGMGDESGEQPSQRQESAQMQAQAAATNRAQAAPSGVSLPQQPFSLAQQQLLSPNWGRAMGERAIMMAQHGPRVAQIQLDPPELGAMQIRIHMQGGDQVSVSFTSPNPMVREALEQQMPRLREMFADQGLNLQDSSVADQSSQQRSGQHDQTPQGHAGSGRYGGGDAGAGEGMTMQAVKVGLVDYYA